MIAAFFAGFLACCGRLGSALSGLVSLTALFFYSIAAALMTYVTLKVARLIATQKLTVRVLAQHSSRLAMRSYAMTELPR